jgi:hypothetical protein
MILKIMSRKLAGFHIESSQARLQFEREGGWLRKEKIPTLGSGNSRPGRVDQGRKSFRVEVHPRQS